MNENSNIEKNFIIWEDKYNTGYKGIDEQHIELIGIINDFYNCVENSNSNKEDIKNVFKRTIDYIIYHFSYEEQLMHSINYNKILDHLSYHKEFTQTISEYINNYENNSLDDIDDVIHYLKNWLLNHILVMDKKFIEDEKDKLENYL